MNKVYSASKDERALLWAIRNHGERLSGKQAWLKITMWYLGDLGTKVGPRGVSLNYVDGN
jgi:hypothetical protein